VKSVNDVNVFHGFYVFSGRGFCVNRKKIADPQHARTTLNGKLVEEGFAPALRRKQQPLLLQLHLHPVLGIGEHNPAVPVEFTHHVSYELSHRWQPGIIQRLPREQREEHYLCLIHTVTRKTEKTAVVTV